MCLRNIPWNWEIVLRHGREILFLARHSQWFSCIAFCQLAYGLAQGPRFAWVEEHVSSRLVLGREILGMCLYRKLMCQYFFGCWYHITAVGSIWPQDILSLKFIL